MASRFVLSGLLLSWVGACSALGPDPAAADASELVVRELDDRQRVALREFEAQAKDAVVRRDHIAAAAAARQALALDPRSARGHAVRGMVLLHQAQAVDPVEYRSLRRGEYELALARQLAPEDAFVGWLHAVFLADTGHLSAAAEAAERALADAEDPSDDERAELYAAAGIYRYELGEERAALPHFDSYLLLRPDDAEAHYRLGVCQLRIAEVVQGPPSSAVPAARARAEAAARAFGRVCELQPDDEAAALAVASALRRAAELAEEQASAAADDRDELTDTAERHLDAAIAQLRAAAERFPDSPLPHYHLGVIAEQRQASAEASAAYTAALDRVPGHVPSLLNLAAATAASDRAVAEGLYRRLLAIDDERPVLAGDERDAIEKWLAAEPEAAGGGR